MSKIYQLPKHKPPVLHESASTMSFEQCPKLLKIYQEVIGTRNITHFSLNVVDARGKMAILSYKPQIAYNIFKDGTYLYNGSISSTYYDNKSLYSWDETYAPSHYKLLKNNMENKNGINKGVVLVKKIHNLTLLYSFATRSDGNDFYSDINESTDQFYEIGDHCFNQINPILQIYSIYPEFDDLSGLVLPSNVVNINKNKPK